MNFWSVLIVGFAAGLEACEDDQGVCLLALRGRPSVSAPVTWKQRQQALLQWKVNHQKLRQDMSSSAQGLSLDMDDFISQQTASTDACHAKMLEAKRTLDGLHAKVLALSGEIEAHDAIILAQTGIIDESTQKKQDAADQLAVEMQQCQDKYDADMVEVLGYDKELIELRQIANPQVRSAIKFDTNYHQAWTNENEKVSAEMKVQANKTIQTGADAWAKVKEWNISNPGTSLVQEWSQAQCQKAVEVITRLRPALAALQTQASPAANVTYVELDCNGTRTELQQEFTTAYEEIAKLRVDTQADTDQAKQNCEGVAQAKEEAERIRENAAINAATEAIDEARETINALDPLLDEAKAALQKVQDHVDDLEQNCGSNTDVTEHLKKIRALITSLDACPGRHDFTLTKPDLAGSLGAAAPTS